MDALLPFLADRWPVLLILCIVALGICFSFRKSAWIIVLWLPLFLISAGYSVVLLLLFLLSAFGGHSSDAGWAVVALMFLALFSLPLIIMAVILFFARPPKTAWQRRYVISAVSTTVVVPLALTWWFTVSKPILTLKVIDEKGTPLSHVGFREIADSPPTAFTDENGYATVRLPRRNPFSLFFSSVGFQACGVTIQLGGEKGENFYVYCTWSEKQGENWIQTHGKGRIFPSAGTPPIPVIMKRLSVQPR